MKVVYNDNANLGGVYRILNLINGKVYYGSTYRFKKRFDGHDSTLRVGSHANTYLQNEYNKHGDDNFLFEVVEIVDGDDKARVAKEQEYLDKFYDNQKQRMNLRASACDTRQGCRQRLPSDPVTDKRCKSPSIEIKEKRAKASKARLDERTPEATQKAREHALNGLWKDHSADVWLVHGATGEEVHVTTSLRAFAEARGLSYKSLHLLKQGKTKSCGGWHMKDKPPVYIERKGEKRKPLSLEHKAKIADKMKGDRFLGVNLISPVGIEMPVPGNVKEFCRENDIHYSTFLKLLKQECKTCSGWKLKVSV